MEFFALLSMVAGGHSWPPAPEAANLSIQIRVIEKGTPLAQVEERLGLAGKAPILVAGTTISHIVEYAIGRTHTLSLCYGRGKNGWEFYRADLRASSAEPQTVGTEWPVLWPKPADIESPVAWDVECSLPWLKSTKP